MNCLCCGKPLRTKEETGWHKACIKHFFMTETLPEIEIDEQALTQLATETIQKGYTVPGVQKKLSLHLFSQTKKPRLTLINYPSGYILKPQVEELYLRLLFSFVVGNSDMHLKNFSLIETEEESGKYVLSPAYDLLPVNVIMPEDKEQFALAMNGKKMNLRRKDFMVFADECGISRTSAEKMIGLLVKKKETFISMCRASFLPEYMQERLCVLINERIKLF